ncbi:MAG: sulfur carrier protein ThiS [Mariprofundaceae bacterium]
MNQVRIYLNGEKQQTDANNIAGLIAELGIEGRMMAVEKNLEVVPKSLYKETTLVEDDRIEIVHMIGGG